MCLPFALPTPELIRLTIRDADTFDDLPFGGPSFPPLHGGADDEKLFAAAPEPAIVGQDGEHRFSARQHKPFARSSSSSSDSEPFGDTLPGLYDDHREALSYHETPDLVEDDTPFLNPFPQPSTGFEDADFQPLFPPSSQPPAFSCAFGAVAPDPVSFATSVSLTEPPIAAAAPKGQSATTCSPKELSMDTGSPPFSAAPEPAPTLERQLSRVSSAGPSDSGDISMEHDELDETYAEPEARPVSKGRGGSKRKRATASPTESAASTSGNRRKDGTLMGLDEPIAPR